MLRQHFNAQDRAGQIALASTLAADHANSRLRRNRLNPAPHQQTEHSRGEPDPLRVQRDDAPGAELVAARRFRPCVRLTQPLSLTSAAGLQLGHQRICILNRQRDHAKPVRTPQVFQLVRDRQRLVGVWCKCRGQIVLRNAADEGGDFKSRVGTDHRCGLCALGRSRARLLCRVRRTCGGQQR